MTRADERAAARWAVHTCLLPLLDGQPRALPAFAALVDDGQFTAAANWLRSRAGSWPENARTTAKWSEVVLRQAGDDDAPNPDWQKRWSEANTAKVAVAAIAAGVEGPVVEMVAAGIPVRVAVDLQAAEEARR